MATTEEERLVETLLRASRSLVGVAIRSVQSARVELTVAQHRVLILLEEGPLGVGEIAVELGVNPSNASRLCDRLQGLGLIERQRSEEDRRSVLVALTEAGREVVEQVRAARRAEITRVVAKLDEHGGAAAVGSVVQALEALSKAAREVELEIRGRGPDRSASS